MTNVAHETRSVQGLRRGAAYVALVIAAAIALAACSAISVRDARIETVDVELARLVLTRAGFSDITVEQKELTREEMVLMLEGLGLPSNVDQSAHATITEVKGSKGEGYLGTFTLTHTSKPCWPERDAIRLDRFVGDYRWGKGTLEVGAWCFIHDADDEANQDCSRELMERILDAAGRAP